MSLIHLQQPLYQEGRQVLRSDEKARVGNVVGGLLLFGLFSAKLPKGVGGFGSCVVGQVSTTGEG